MKNKKNDITPLFDFFLEKERKQDRFEYPDKSMINFHLWWALLLQMM